MIVYSIKDMCNGEFLKKPESNCWVGNIDDATVYANVQSARWAMSRLKTMGRHYHKEIIELYVNVLDHRKYNPKT